MPHGEGELPSAAGAVNLGDDALCAVINNGALRCWGRNDSGQLGYGGIDHLGDNESVSTAGTVLYR